LHQQLPTGARVCLALPAWLRRDGSYRDLELIKPIYLKRLGFELVKLRHVDERSLLYHRDDQIVARRIVILRKA